MEYLVSLRAGCPSRTRTVPSKTATAGLTRADPARAGTVNPTAGSQRSSALTMRAQLAGRRRLLPAATEAEPLCHGGWRGAESPPMSRTIRASGSSTACALHLVNAGVPAEHARMAPAAQPVVLC